MTCVETEMGADCFRLAAFICNYEVFQITVRSGYGVVDFKADLLTLYRRAGKGNQVLHLGHV